MARTGFGTAIFTTGQVAKMCKVAPRTVAKWFDSGRLDGYRIPGSEDRRIPRESLKAFLAKHRMPIPMELQGESAVGVVWFGENPELLEADVCHSAFQLATLLQSHRPAAIVIEAAVLGRALPVLIEEVRKTAGFGGKIFTIGAAPDEVEELRAHGARNFQKPVDVALLSAAIGE